MRVAVALQRRRGARRRRRWLRSTIVQLLYTHTHTYTHKCGEHRYDSSIAQRHFRRSLTIIGVVCQFTHTKSHSVDACVLTKSDGGLSSLHSADDDAVQWSASLGRWTRIWNNNKTTEECVALSSQTLEGITTRLMNRSQSVLNAAASLVCNSQKYDRISPLLRDLHWFRVPERIKFRLAILVFHCRNQTAPEYLSRELQWAVYDEPRRRQTATVPSALPILAYWTAYQPTLSLHSRWQQYCQGTA